MLDEVDKLGRDFRGDPAAALMEILDPAQNKEFRDNYLNLPFDLSKVFFITTANHLDGVPPPLLDRMEVLDLTGYSELEKLEIARRYLIPRQRDNAGLKDEQLSFTDEALSCAIRRHTREAGVRELDRVIGRIASKRARKIVQSEDASAPIAADDLPTLLGPEKFKTDRQRENMGPGVAPGLAYTESGGDVLYVEATLTHKGRQDHHHRPSRPSDARIHPGGAILYLVGGRSTPHRPLNHRAKRHPRTRARWRRPERRAIGWHHHGDRVGIALQQQERTRRHRHDRRVDAIRPCAAVGGIREKVLAAHRTGIRHVILPRDNEAELAKLPAPVRDEMEVTLVDCLEDAVKVAIPGLHSSF